MPISYPVRPRRSIGPRTSISKDFNITFPFNLCTALINSIVYHDVVYDAHRHDNEDKSADLWIAHRKMSDHYEVADIDDLIVEQNIRDSGSHFDDRDFNVDNPEHLLREWFLGLDLASLAAPFEIFQMNTSAIRTEYNHISDQEWKAGRGKFLEFINTKERIYKHPVMHELFEQRARDNIKMSRESLCSPETKTRLRIAS
jgi:predicted metal-dependent HD superfamily phosphohydrolase